MDCLKMTFDAEMYPKEALLKASYFFIDRYYLHLRKVSEQYCVDISTKNEESLPDDIQKQFENELLSQTVRYQVYQETHDIREILVARAMASTVIMSRAEKGKTDKTSEQEPVRDINHIFEDWYARE